MPDDELVNFYDLTQEASEHAFSLWQGSMQTPHVPGLWEEAYASRIEEFSAALSEALEACGIEVAESRDWGSIYFDLKFRHVEPDCFDEKTRMGYGTNDDFNDVAEFYNEAMDAAAAKMAYARLALDAHDRYLDVIAWDAPDELSDDATKAFQAIETTVNDILGRLARYVVDKDDSIMEDTMSVEFFEDRFVPNHLFKVDGTPVDVCEREHLEQGGETIRGPRR